MDFACASVGSFEPRQVRATTSTEYGSSLTSVGIRDGCLQEKIGVGRFSGRFSRRLRTGLGGGWGMVDDGIGSLRE